MRPRIPVATALAHTCFGVAIGVGLMAPMLLSDVLLRIGSSAADERYRAVYSTYSRDAWIAAGVAITFAVAFRAVGTLSSGAVKEGQGLQMGP